MRETTDILVAGGGIGGLTAAAALVDAGYHVTLVSPAPPVLDAEAAGSDLRSTAFLQPATDLFERIGLWGALAKQATPLDVLRIVDSVGWPPKVRTERAFHADDLSERPFGYNLLNWQTLAVLMEHLTDNPMVDLRFGTRFDGMVQRDREVIVKLSDGERLRARLVVAADGRASAVRQVAGIDVTTTRYGQKALAFVVGHEQPHENVSTEIYNEGGPFTIVPLPDQPFGHASAIVWMNPGARALDLFNLPDDAFSRAATERSCNWLGKLTLKGQRRMWPIVAQRAHALTAQRVAILAEAAHVVPPIGAQGLNTSLNDIIALTDALAHGNDPGDDTVLRRFETARKADIARRVAAIDLFNRVTRSGLPALQTVRLAGLKTLHGAKPLRQAIMRAGLGTSG